MSAAPSSEAAATPLPAGVCVLGLGLIGGSLLRAAAPIVPSFGWSPGAGTRESATADGYDVEPTLVSALQRAAKQDALVVLASPVTTFPELLRAVDEHAPQVRLTDVGSVKIPVAEAVAQFAPRARFIGSHPMTGSALSGWDAGSAGLFADRVWVTIVDDETDLADWLPVAALALAVGSKVVPCEADAHDDAAARISHLPHLLAMVLAQVGAAGGPLALSLAAGSFTDGTRVAATRADLVRAICEPNAQPLLRATDEALGLLGVARASLASTGSLAKLAEGGNRGRAEFDRRFADLAPVTLRGTDLIDQLLAVGAAGGYVTGIELADSGPDAVEHGPVEHGPGGHGLVVHAMYPTDD